MPGTDPALPSLRDDHDALCRAVGAAGALVLERFRQGPGKARYKDDRTPVTEADLAANALLKDHLLTGERSGYGWLSEESADDPSRLEATRTFVIDPIDGTRAFLQGRPEFCVCAAIVEDGAAISAAIFNPVTEEFFEAVAGGGARRNGEVLSASAQSGTERCRMLSAPEMFTHPRWPEPWPQMRHGYRNSTNYRMALVAAGEFDASIALIPKADWDVAPGALIAEEAGACVSDHLGARFVHNREVPRQRALVCAAPKLYPDLLRRLAHLPADLNQIVL